MNKNDKIESLLNELAEIGKESFVTEAQDKMSKWAKIGMAISHVNDYPLHGFEILYEWLEDWNYHAHCAVIDWIVPKENKFWDTTLEYVKKMIDRNNVEIAMWNDDMTEIVTKHANITVNIEWLD
jgi:hypothetical protein